MGFGAMEAFEAGQRLRFTNYEDPKQEGVY